MDVEFERESLYREVWSSPISTLAKKYGLSDNGLRKVCVALAIPLPARGYWAKAAAGHQLTIPALPPTDGRTFVVSRPSRAEDASNSAPAPQPDNWLQERLAFETAPENAVLVQAELTNPHRLVASTAKAVSAECAALRRSRERLENPPKLKPGQRWEPDWEAFSSPSWRDYEDRGGIMDLSACSAPMRVSIETADRALRIWDAIIKACEARSMRASAEHLVVKISLGRDYVGLRISEQVDLTKRAVVPGMVPATVRKAAGRLRMVVVDRSETRFNDSTERPLEAQLNDILMRIYRCMALQRVRRIEEAEKLRRDEAAARAREEERAAEAEAARLREEELQRQRAAQAAKDAIRAQEIERERALISEATTWREAQAIRDYIRHLEGAATISGTSISLELQRWLDWAALVAEKLDPTSGRLLGVPGREVSSSFDLASASQPTTP
jgi:hypothetical protein